MCTCRYSCVAVCLQVVDVNLTSEGKVKLEAGMTLSFTYQVCHLCVIVGSYTLVCKYMYVLAVLSQPTWHGNEAKLQ